jgi:anti-sigma-K factor RskA
MTGDHERRWDDEVAAYALGALEPAEAAELEAHLEECEHCRMALRWLSPAVQVLPESVERVKAPRQVRENVISEVRADAKRSRRAEGGLLARLRLRQPKTGSLAWRPIAALAVMALAVVAIAGYEIGSDGSSGGEASAPIVVGEAPGVVAEMIPEGDGGTLQLENVSQLPDDRVLEAWVQREGEVEPVRALFVPDHEGHAKTIVADMEGVETVMVTTEPKGGSELPTSDPIVTMPIPE